MVRSPFVLRPSPLPAPNPPRADQRQAPQLSCRDPRITMPIIAVHWTWHRNLKCRTDRPASRAIPGANLTSQATRTVCGGIPSQAAARRRLAHRQGSRRIGPRHPPQQASGRKINGERANSLTLRCPVTCSKPPSHRGDPPSMRQILRAQRHRLCPVSHPTCPVIKAERADIQYQSHSCWSETHVYSEFRISTVHRAAFNFGAAWAGVDPPSRVAKMAWMLSGGCRKRTACKDLAVPYAWQQGHRFKQTGADQTFATIATDHRFFGVGVFEAVAQSFRRHQSECLLSVRCRAAGCLHDLRK